MTIDIDKEFAWTGADRVLVEQLNRMRASVHPGRLTEDRGGDDKAYWRAVRNRIEQHARTILDCVEKFDRCAEWAKRVKGEK